jgi:hypothetical protein
MASHLVGLKGLHWGQELSLSQETTLGRESSNAISCDGDSSVSRKHAVIVASGAGFSIHDLGSANGTFVNGVRIAGPTMLNPGDEIGIGGQSYRFEAEPAAIPQARPVEVSRGEQAAQFPRGTERIYGDSSGDLRGCSLPRIDLPDMSGCLRILLLMLLAFLALALIAGLLFLLSMGVGALGGLAGGHKSSTSSSSGGGAPPSSQGEQQKSTNGIYIRTVRVVSNWRRPSGGTGPGILVGWDNQTDKTVHKIWAKVTALDAQGNVLGTAADVLIYDGKSVLAGGTHDDSPIAGDGFDVPPGTQGTPASAKVEVTNYE